jgi:hypothetical protein
MIRLCPWLPLPLQLALALVLALATDVVAGGTKTTAAIISGELITT